MVRRFTLRAMTAMAAVGFLALAVGCSGKSPEASASGGEPSKKGEDPQQSKEIGTHLYPVKAGPVEKDPGVKRASMGALIVIPECRLAIMYKQEVPSTREGQILVTGREITPEEADRLRRNQPEQLVIVPFPYMLVEVEADEQVPADQLYPLKGGAAGKRYRFWREGDPIEPGKIYLDKKEKAFRRLQVGDEVKKGQLLALLDYSLAFDDLNIKNAKLVASEADWIASVKTVREAEQREKTAEQLYRKGATSLEEYRGAILTKDRYIFEEVSKKQAINLAKSELSQARTTVGMYEVRSKIDGVVKTLYKNQGEAVRNLEPIIQLHDPRWLQVEGLVDVQYLPVLEKMKANGEKLVVEATQPVPPLQQFRGHLDEVTCVVVTNDAKDPQVVSGSLDRTVRVWDGKTEREHLILPHPSPVRAVACTPAGVKENLCLAGMADGQVWIWDLRKASNQEPRPLKGRHKSAVNCVAFSPDGEWCVTGGDDMAIYLWETATGNKRYQFPGVHRGRITGLQFTKSTGKDPKPLLVSAGGDNSLLVWAVGTEGARLEEKSRFDERGGEVSAPGVSPDGKRVLFDKGKELMVLSMEDRGTEGVLQNSGGANFTTMALFSPDGKVILTASGSEGRLQLWRAPNGTARPYEMRQLVVKDAPPATSGAFAPDGSFVATGMKDRQVLVWPVPSKAEVDHQLKAEITLVERFQDSSSRPVRIWAKIDNKDNILVPGAPATLAAYSK